MMNRKKIIMIVVIAALITGAVLFYIVTKKPPTAADSKPVIELQAKALINQLSNNKHLADSTYMYNNISVSGKIKDISGTNLIIGAGESALVNCSFDSTTFESIRNTIKVGQEVTIKGIYFGCSGFDASADDDLDLIPTEKEAKLRTCVLVNSQSEK